jgi:hypothetical protein
MPSTAVEDNDVSADGHDFFDVPTTAVSTSAGDATLPIPYFDCSYYLAVFQVDAEAARQSLNGTGLEPLVAKRKAIATLSFFKYRNTGIGPYHEVGLSLLAVPAGQQPEVQSLTDILQKPETMRRSGSFVLDLPVSTALACAAGREIWGFPKFVTELPITLSGDRFEGRILDPDGLLIMELSGERGYGVGDELPGTDVVAFSVKDGQLLRTRVRTRYHGQVSGGGTLTVTIGNSEHRMAGNLRQLGLDQLKPKLFQTTEHFQSLLYPGEPL